MSMKQDTIVLSGEFGKELEFELIAEINYEDTNYVILKPIKKYDDIDPDMAMVFRVEVTKDGDNYFIEEDDDIISAIEEIYNDETNY